MQDHLDNYNQIEKVIRNFNTEDLEIKEISEDEDESNDN